MANRGLLLDWQTAVSRRTQISEEKIAAVENNKREAFSDKERSDENSKFNAPKSDGNRSSSLERSVRLTKAQQLVRQDRTFLTVFLALSVTVALLVMAAWMSMQLLNGIRAYVGGEGLYSKGQKQAVFLLTDYMYSGEERSYREFKDALTIPQGDRRARIELEKENPNWKIVLDGFLAGGNHSEDIDDLILLFRRFRYVPFVSDAVAVWTEGDAFVAKLNDLGAKVHSQWQQQSFSAAHSLPAARYELWEINARLTKLENAFSERLGEGARLTRRILLTAIILLGALLWGAGTLISWRLISALSSEQRQLAAVIDNVPAGIVLAEAPSGRIRMANAQVPQLLGGPTSRYLDAEFGSGWNALHPDGRRLEWHEYPLACAIRGENVRGQDLMWFREDGSTTWIRVSAAPVKTHAGEVVGAVGVFYDVAEEKQVEEALIRQAEELARSNADLEEFAYITSHDLKEPVRTIGLYAELLSRRYGGQLDANADTFLRYIKGSAERMGDLVRDVLRYSQVLNVDARVMTEVDMRMVVEWARSNLTAQAHETGGVIEVGELPLVTGDQQQLVQLLQNLLANSLKYSGGRRPHIRVRAEPVKEGWLFRVEDNGIGIAAEYKERIFGVFKRLHGRDVPGTGIGLALCKRIVERHRGRIWVESQPGVGSSFCFLLPLLTHSQVRTVPADRIEFPSASVDRSRIS